MHITLLVTCTLIWGCATLNVDIQPASPATEQTSENPQKPEEEAEPAEKDTLADVTPAEDPVADNPANDSLKVVIMGDSYSTFEGYIPKGYSNWYWPSPKNQNDVTSVDETWWKILCDRMGYKLLLNDSYSGSCVCTTGYNGDATATAFVTRVKTSVVDENGKIGLCGSAPDIIFIFGGTNDCWCGAPVGDVQEARIWKKAKLEKCLPAMSYLLGYLKFHLPDTRLIIINNCDICANIVGGFQRAAREYGAECIQLYEIDKQGGHPSVKGMVQIADQLETFLGK